jgi:ClpX C4-type zinc finger protein
MIDTPSTDKLDPFAEKWQSAMKQGNFKEAVKAGYESYAQCESEGDEKGAMAALSLVHLAIAELIFGNRKETQGKLPTPSCSFCGRSGSEVKLGAGPDAFICVDCVAIFHDALASDDAPRV